MSWLSSPEGASRLDEVVSLFNQALDLLERDGTEVDAARCLSDALSKIPAEWSRLASQEVVSEVETLQAMLGQASSSDAQAELLSSDAFEKAERDEAVGSTVIPVQLLLVNLLLDRPDERLVIYGTLAPGKPNHNVIEDLSGDYRNRR
jgi:hypothetical protein